MLQNTQMEYKFINSWNLQDRRKIQTTFLADNTDGILMIDVTATKTFYMQYEIQNSSNNNCYETTQKK